MKKKQLWRTNGHIRAEKVRVIDANGEQLGVLRLSEALAKAKEQEKDLVEIAPKANPPVTRIVEFGKFKYEQEKKLRKQKAKAKSSELKEIRFSPFIGDGDFNTRLTRINEFLDDNNKVKLTVVFKGRQMGSKKFGYDLLERVMELIRDRVSIDMAPRFFGRRLSMVVSPSNKKGVKNAKVQEQEITKKED